MITIKKYLQYLFLFNLSIISSFSLIYSDRGNFEENFSELGLSLNQLFFIYNILTSATYLLLSYLFRINESIVKHNLVFFTTTFVIIIYMWLVKFIDLSRWYLVTSSLLFILLTIFFTRFLEKNNDEIFVSFDKSLSEANENIEFIDHTLFPEDFLDTLSELLTKKNLKGLIYDNQNFNKLGFDQVIELSNFLGVNIYENNKNKYRVIHESTSLNNLIKNIEDIILLILLIPVFVPLCLLISLTVLIFDGFPIIYTQNRVGLNGRYFKIYKFRTMRNTPLDSTELEKLNEKNKIVFKSSKDPRITRLGSLLRKSSMDELPQIMNVLKNDMSFVGPRPPIIEEVKQYELKHLKRISVKPGITGLWQVTLRKNNDFDTWVAKDIEYIENWSLSLDVKILFMTIFEIIKLSGE